MPKHNASQIKERPQMRAAIVSQGLSPFIENGRWDGFRAKDPQSQNRRCCMGDALKKQMRKMVAEGFWNYLLPSGRIKSAEDSL